MSTPLKAVISIIEKMIPPDLAETWDNVGLQIGDPLWPIKTVRVALDPTLEVVQTCCQDGVDLLLTHHPLIFKSIKKIDLQTPQGAIFKSAISNQLAIYAAHTNFDRLSDGLNELLARRIELTDLKPLESGGEWGDSGDQQEHGLGRIGRLKHSMSLIQLAEMLKTKLSLDYIRMAGRSDLNVDTVALCTGSGSGLLELFMGCEAQVYVSGDLRYHDARMVEEADLGLLDIGHFQSEHLMVEALVQRLTTTLANERLNVSVTASQVETDPFRLV